MYTSHRKALCQKLKEGIVFSFGNKALIRNGYDVSLLFRQDSNFLYLTGIEEPGYAFILLPSENKYVLFIPKIDAKHIVWLGKTPSLTEAKNLFGADQVYYMDQLETELSKLSKVHKTVFFLKTNNLQGLKIYKKVVRKKPLEDKLLLALSELRVIKSKEEISLMQKAADISATGHIEAMKKCQTGLYEYQIQSFLEQKFRENGSFQNAYLSIVGSGKNSAILHYFQNQAQLKKGELLLIDAGAEVHGYGADITRTFPISGKFSKEQKDVYELTLKAQFEAMKMVKAGVQFQDLHDKASCVIVEGLKDLGFLKGAISSMLEQKLENLFFPHGLGHFLGLDVHDVAPMPSRVTKKQASALRTNRILEENNVITIEPGIYFIPVLLQDSENRKKFKDFVNWKKVDSYLGFGGIRIEDDVVVTKEGCKILTSKTPKKVEDLEKIIGAFS